MLPLEWVISNKEETDKGDQVGEITCLKYEMGWFIFYIP